MFNSFKNKLVTALSDKSIRNRLLFIAGMILIFRFLSALPVPGIDSSRLAMFFESNQFLNLLNLFSGGGLSALSIVMLGVGPYITASIIMQLLTVMVPRLKQMYHEEGQIGRRKFMQYSRMLAVPLSIVQALGFIVLLERQSIISELTTFAKIVNIIIITGGSVLLMWIGELMSEFGIGNGTSIIIFAGIVASIPQHISQFMLGFDTTQIPAIIGFVVALVVIVLGVVIMNEAQRPLAITYSRQTRIGAPLSNVHTYLPLRFNQAGVMPIIFALSILLFPQMMESIVKSFDISALDRFFTWYRSFTNDLLWYGIVYFVLVFLFTFFYVAITFDPSETAKNLQKSGAYVPGVRPGVGTEEYISKVLSRVTFAGGLFLALVAVLPIIMQSITGVSTLAVGGTALLIVVSVVIDLIKRVDAQIAMKHY